MVTHCSTNSTNRVIALLNLIFDWWNKSFSLFVMGAIIILTVALFIYMDFIC